MPGTSNSERAAVLIVSDDAAFSRALTGRWQSERNLPAFTVVGSDLCCGEMGGGDPGKEFHAAIAGKVDSGRLHGVIHSLSASGKPVLLIGERGASRMALEAHPRLLVVQQGEGWLDTVVLVMNEVLRRREEMRRIQRLEQESCTLQHDATLGRYVLEMRHTLNNALTAVLGNAELLLLEPGMLNSGALAQVETVRNMGLRIHEIMQRFSSLEKELSVMQRQAEKDGQSMVRTAARAASAN